MQVSFVFNSRLEGIWITLALLGIFANVMYHHYVCRWFWFNSKFELDFDMRPATNLYVYIYIYIDSVMTLINLE